MANQITAAGIETDTLAETVANLTDSFTTIYSPNVAFGAQAPDGQLLNDFAQVVQDELDLTVQVYTSMDPDQAIGVTLDMRVALNCIKRQEGSYSTTDESILTSGAVSLVGLDGASPLTPPAGLYLVSDPAGNQWGLVNSYDIGSAGTTILTFQAMQIGAVATSANTLTIPVTVVAGVISVNNPASQLSIGTAAESDAALKIRRRQSTSINATGFSSAMEAALLNTPGVTYAQVYENDTATTGIPQNGAVPGHSLWVVVGGTASDAAIAQAIYSKRSAGCGTYGAVSFQVTRVNGPVFQINWDVVSAEALFVKFQSDAVSGDITGIDGTFTTGSRTVTLTTGTTAGLLAGYPFRATGIPVGTTIASITDSTHLVLSANPTSNETATALTVVPIVSSTLSAAMAANFTAAIDASVNIGQIITLIQSINPNVLPTSVQVSIDGSTWLNVVSPSTAAYQFTLAQVDVTIL